MESTVACTTYWWTRYTPVNISLEKLLLWGDPSSQYHVLNCLYLDDVTLIGKLLWVMEMLIASWPVWHEDQFHGWRQMKYYGANSFMEKAEWVRLCSWFNANHAMVHKTNESTHDRSWANTLKKSRSHIICTLFLKTESLKMNIQILHWN